MQWWHKCYGSNQSLDWLESSLNEMEPIPNTDKVAKTLRLDNKARNTLKKKKNNFSKQETKLKRSVR